MKSNKNCSSSLRLSGKTLYSDFWRVLRRTATKRNNCNCQKISPHVWVFRSIYPVSCSFFPEMWDKKQKSVNVIDSQTPESRDDVLQQQWFSKMLLQ